VVRVATASKTPPAEPDGVTDAYVCRLLPLTFARASVEAILDEREPME
jgi:hypothetical protein